MNLHWRIRLFPSLAWQRVRAAWWTLRGLVEGESPFWRDDPPTVAERAAHVRQHTMWTDTAWWQYLMPADQTVWLDVVDLGANTQSAVDQAVERGACAWRPLSMTGDPVPWPRVPR